MDFSKAEITRAGDKITVTPQEFKTLEFVAKNANRVISREEPLNEVWGYQNYPHTRTVDNHILKLRQKLESDPSHPLHFLTVYCQGYKCLLEAKTDLRRGFKQSRKTIDVRSTGIANHEIAKPALTPRFQVEWQFLRKERILQLARQ